MDSLPIQPTKPCRPFAGLVGGTALEKVGASEEGAREDGAGGTGPGVLSSCCGKHETSAVLQCWGWFLRDPKRSLQLPDSSCITDFRPRHKTPQTLHMACGHSEIS